MHGRLKVKTTAEQEEAKQKERDKKLKLYRAGTGRLFQKYAIGEYDNEGLRITGELLSANPDFYSLWNYRRHTFHSLKQSLPAEEVQTCMETELGFLEQCLRITPKSYGTWHHRGWILQHMPKADWAKELTLCNKFLEFDERNFHCWDYRRLVVHESNVSATDELTYTTNKIESNFSNYSSWHYRSKLLPIVYPHPTHPIGVQEEQLVDEYLLAQNAFFTDPNDQSAWFYHKWLLGRVTRDLRLESVQVCRNKQRIAVQLSKASKVDAERSICVSVGGIQIDIQWNSANGEIYSTLWTCEKVTELSNPDTCIEISVSIPDIDAHACTLTLEPQVNTTHWRREYKSGTRFCHEFSAVASDTLTQELSSLQQLHDLEPDNKWVLLTIVSLMRALDPLKYEEDTFQSIDMLLLVDPMRTNYYNDLRSRIVIENALECLENDKTYLDLSSHGLTTLAHTDSMITIQTLNLAHNKLTRLGGVQCLQSIRVLNLDDNGLNNCIDVHHLSSLEELSLCDNNISSTEDLQPLRSCSQLTRLHLKGNPVCKRKTDIVEFLMSIKKH